ncbi:hypothetical protein OS493_010614, partial [Desmophyllum pertusum]
MAAATASDDLAIGHYDNTSGLPATASPLERGQHANASELPATASPQETDQLQSGRPLSAEEKGHISEIFKDLIDRFQS